MSIKEAKSKAINTFINGIIDYAGLFPPASLNLRDSLTKYLNYMKTNEYDLVSSFVLPVTQLDNLIPTLKEIELDYNNFTISFVATRAEGAEKFIASIQSDINKITSFLKNNNNFSVKAFEIMLPSDLAYSSDIKRKEAILFEVSDLLNEANLNAFFEVPAGENWIDASNGLIKILASYNSKNSKKVSYKIRCGGVKPEMTPSNEKVVSAIQICTQEKVSMKATAGLHHPFRHFNEDLGGIMHGFVNVFTAVILSRTKNLQEEVLVEIINDEDTNNFIWSENSLMWKNYEITIEDMLQSKEFISSYGSCSFDEPIDDLKELKLL